MASSTTMEAQSINKIEPKTSDESLNKLIKNYLKLERNEQHRQHIVKLVEKNNEEQLTALIGKRLTFGTAGIRGRMGPGFGQMNDLVIIQTSQGLASYLLELDANSIKDRGVIIGFDARHNSDRFARLAAIAFLEKSIPVYFCDHIIPTPLIAYGVKHFGCQAGIVVTASHNPKNDNGYKVFWSNGAQILSPHDAGIQAHILRESNQIPWSLSRSWQEELLRVGTGQSTSSLPREWEDLLFRVHGELSKSYFTYIEGIVGDRHDSNQASSICITYTTMHGVGHLFLSRALDLAGFDDVFPVEPQKKPDPNFSTVRFPNPEESGALDLAFETAKHANSNLILANDPDSDRCGAALYDPVTQNKRILSGNEIGSLLGWWLWHCHITPAEQSPPNSDQDTEESEKQQEEQSSQQEEDIREQRAQQKEESEKRRKSKPEDCYMISTAVSSKFLQTMARREGFQFIETLTGFKYMGNIADELIKKHKFVMFAFEEAIGYMVDSSILDKDGISAAIQIAQCAAYLSATYQRTLEQHLDWLYTVYGYHYNINSYYTCSDQAVIREIFQNLQSNYPTNFQTGGHQFRVTRVRDLNVDYDSSTPDKRATLPSSSSSYMITFFVDNDITLTIRTSGTEPKIKYYSEIVAKLPRLANESAAIGSNNFNTPEQVAAKEAARRRLRLLVQTALEHCLRPNLYDLEPAE